MNLISSKFAKQVDALKLFCQNQGPDKGGNTPGAELFEGAALLVKRRNSKWSLPLPSGGSGGGGRHFSTRPGAALLHVGALARIAPRTVGQQDLPYLLDCKQCLIVSLT